MGHRRSFRSGRSGISDAQRRKKTWSAVALQGFECDGLTIIPATPVIGTATLALAQIRSSVAIEFVEGTILRIRGSLDVGKTSPGANTEAFGIAFVSDEAADAGVVPNPATVAGASWDGWMFYRSNVLSAVSSDGSILDSKAMRKWDGGQSLVLVSGACTESGSPGVPVGTQISARFLFLLP